MHHINLQEMRDHLSQFKEIRFQNVVIDGKRLVIVHYMIWNNNLLSEPLSLEARGIVFDADTGECICRPFEKFFNVGEQEFTQPKDLLELPWKDSVITKKRDGSLLTPVLVNGNIHWKSKKSFTSDLVKDFMASGLPIEQYNKQVAGLLLHGMTPIFEYTSHEFKIVIDYGAQPKLTLLAIRNNLTGEYLEPEKHTANWFGFDLIESVPIGWKQLIDMQHTVAGEEGWVVHFKNSIRVKFKTDWYLARHRVLDLRERDVADSLINETIDDIYPMIQECGYDINRIREIENRVAKEFVLIDEEITALYQEAIKIDRTAVAQAFPGHELLPALFAKLDNNAEVLDKLEKKIWTKRYRRGYTLRSVTNSKFGQEI